MALTSFRSSPGPKLLGGLDLKLRPTKLVSHSLISYYNNYFFFRVMGQTGPLFYSPDWPLFLHRAGWPVIHFPFGPFGLDQGLISTALAVF